MTNIKNISPIFTVIIPYYQRESGILNRALKSIANQDCKLPTHVIVVNDSSPIPPDGEFESIHWQDHFSFQVIDRANGGPAAARNLGLNNVPSSCRYIAFLDSDDEWSSNHLSNAWTALEKGNDFYFSNHLQLGQRVGAFERAGRIDLNAHKRINDSIGLYAYHGQMIDQILTGNVIGTSTVIFRRAIAKDLRFREEYRNAGEDYIFWLELAKITNRICFSSKNEAIYGKGVNIYSGVKWGTEEHMSRIRNEMRFKLFSMHNFKLSKAVHHHVKSSINKLRYEYCLDLFHIIKGERRIPVNELKKQLHVDARTFLCLPTSLMSHIFKR